MSFEDISLGFIWGSIIIISLYDLIPAFNDKPGDTISEVIREMTSRWWSFPFAWGVLGGHWFGPEAIKRPEYGPISLAILGAILFFANLLRLVKIKSKIAWALFHVIGWILGMWLWSLNK